MTSRLWILSRHGYPVRHNFGGEPTRERIKDVGRRLRSRSSGLDGVVVDLRESLEDELLEGLLDLRKPVLNWLLRGGDPPDRQLPLIVLAKGRSGIPRMREWAMRRGGPSLWFALGYELLDGSAIRDAKAIEDSGQLAVKRLERHPLIVMNSRARDLFGRPGKRVPASTRGFPTCLGPVSSVRREMAQRRELAISCPSTYQPEGGLSVELPHEVRESVLDYVVRELTGGDDDYGDDSGYTALPGRGWWYNKTGRQAVAEGVEWVMVHAKLGAETAMNVARYLRWAWLQDSVFLTLDGEAVSAD